MGTGKKIGEECKRQGMTLRQLSIQADVPYSTLSSMVKRDSDGISMETMERLTKAMNVSAAYLMGWEEQPEPKQPTIPPGFEPMPRMRKIPLIGSIACGTPITAEQNIEKMVDVPESIRCDFSLTCHGDSMVDAGIHDRDVVYIHIQPEVENGQIAAVRIGEEATLKRVYYSDGVLTLMPANPAYAPMVYTGPQLDEVQIEGRAVGWTHWIG